MSRASVSTPSKPATTTTPSAVSPQMVPHEKIAMRAYDKWCRRGCPPGTSEQDWFEAEAELKAEASRAAARK